MIIIHHNVENVASWTAVISEHDAGGFFRIYSNGVCSDWTCTERPRVN